MTRSLLLWFSMLLAASSAFAELPDEARRRDAVKHYRAGQSALLAEHWDEAEQEFRAATHLDPLLAEAYYGLGQVYMAEKRYPDAVRAYGACRDAFLQEAAEAALDRVTAERRLDDQILALRDNINALQSGRVSSANKGSSTQRLEDQIRGLESRKHRSGDGRLPTPPGVSLALGSAHFRNEAFDDAEREYQAAIAVDPGLGEAHNNLAVVYMLTGRLDDAEREVGLAEKAGFGVSSGLKQDILQRRAEVAH